MDRRARAASDEMHGRDQAAALLGYEVVSVDAGRAVVRMFVRDDMVNGLAVCHGGLIFTLADSAMAHASNSHGPDAVAVAASIDLVRSAPAGAVLTAEAVERYRRGRTGLYDVVVTDGDGELVARFHGRTRALGQKNG
jgi:acyl-CoA thioesterase